MITAEKILKKPLISEKATVLSSEYNQYVFKVYSDANRTVVAQAVEKSWSVEVKKVNIINVKPKTRSHRHRRGKPGHRPGYKKAIVTLKAGDNIEII